MMINRYYFKAAVVMATLLLSTGCASLQIPPDKQKQHKVSADVFELTFAAEQAYQQSRWIEAVRIYQQIVEQVPHDADAWFRLGNIYAQQGVFERAIHAYESSLNYNSEQPKAWFNLSTAYLLNARAAMRGAHGRLRAGDPARSLIEARLISLDALVHGRFEDGVSPAALR